MMPISSYECNKTLFMHQPFSVKEALWFGWHTVRAHSALVFKVVLTLFSLQVAQAIVAKVLEGTALGVLAGIVLGIGGAVVGVGVTVISLRLAEHAHTSFADIIPAWSLIWRVLVVGAVAGLLIALPTIVAFCMIVAQLVSALGYDTLEAAVVSIHTTPDTAGETVRYLLSQVSNISVGVGSVGVVLSAYLALRYSMVRYFIIDKAGIVDSLRKSWHMTGGAIGRLLLFGLAAIVLNVLGAIPVGLGLLVTIPITMIAFAHVYVKLKNRA